MRSMRCLRTRSNVCAACGYGLARPFQPNGATPEYEVTWRSASLLQSSETLRLLQSFPAVTLAKCVPVLVTHTDSLHSPEKLNIQVFSLETAAWARKDSRKWLS